MTGRLGRRASSLLIAVLCALFLVPAAGQASGAAAAGGPAVVHSVGARGDLVVATVVVPRPAAPGHPLPAIGPETCCAVHLPRTASAEDAVTAVGESSHGPAAARAPPLKV